MQLTDYQQRATATVLYPKNLAFYYLRPGLLIEVLELEKAFYRHSDLNCYLEDCGNIAWFVANSFTALGLNLEQYQQWIKPAEGLDSLARGIDILKCHADKICAIHIKTICDRNSAAIEALRFHLSTIFHTLDLMAPLLRTNLAAILQMSADDLAKCQPR